MRSWLFIVQPGKNRFNEAPWNEAPNSAGVRGPAESCGRAGRTCRAAGPSLWPFNPTLDLAPPLGQGSNHDTVVAIERTRSDRADHLIHLRLLALTVGVAVVCDGLLSDPGR